ncbi:nucleosidase, partial [Streptomyces sp. NPDC101149]|uniref:nucleosidase n=1 Tax=Streptomyces sp. NPDC101149 TaxID=3366113 RepID=UPI0038138631
DPRRHPRSVPQPGLRHHLLAPTGQPLTLLGVLIGTVIQHDLDSATLHNLTGEIYGEPIRLVDHDGPTLATGDSFIADEATRARLAKDASLVDMEGYALATAAHRAGVSLRIVKHVSDDAGDGAARTWQESVADCARALAHWAACHLPSYA